MKNYLYQSMFSFAVCLTLFSCNSKNEADNGQQTMEADKDTTILLTAYNSKKGQNIQTFEISTNKQQTIKGKQGTLVTFPAQCFGKEKKIKIELIECYSIQEMLLNGLSTQTTDGKLLESDGMIYLNALNDKGDILEIKQGNVKVQMSTKQKKTGMRIFEGVGNNNGVSWNLSTVQIENKSKNNSIEHEELIENISIDTFEIKTQNIENKTQYIIDKQIKNENLVNYVFNISKMGWINCDRYIEGETKPLIVKVPKESTGASYYLILKNYNSSVPPKTTSNGRLSFMIPINEPFTIVALSSKGENIYFNMLDYTGEKSEVDFSELKPLNRQELTDLLMIKFGKDIWHRPLA